MVNLTKQQTSPVHIENTVQNLGKKELNINNRFHTFREMQYDGIISASLNFLISVMNRPFEIQPHEEATSTELKVTEALNKSLNNLEPYTKREVTNNLLTVLTYGCSLNEVVFKREKGVYVFDNISPIHMTKVKKFNYLKGRLQNIELTPPDNDGLISNIDSKEKKIDGSKILMACLHKNQDNPLGQSLLTGVWQAWKQKQVISEYELIHISKSYGNILKVSVPASYINAWLNDPQSEEGIYTAHLLNNAELLHAGRSSYSLLPSDVYEGGQNQFSIEPISKTENSDYSVDTTINRLNDEMLLSLQTSLLSLGNSGSGSFALSDSKTNLLTMVVRSVHETISDAFTKHIKQAFELNNLSTDRLPQVVFQDVEPVDFDSVSSYFQRLVGVGAIVPDSNLDDHLRKLGGVKPSEGDYSSLFKELREGTYDDNTRIQKEL